MKQRINICMSSGNIDKLDAIKKQYDISRSRLIEIGITLLEKHIDDYVETKQHELVNYTINHILEIPKQ